MNRKTTLPLTQTQCEKGNIAIGFGGHYDRMAKFSRRHNCPDDSLLHDLNIANIDAARPIFCPCVPLLRVSLLEFAQPFSLSPSFGLSNKCVHPTSIRAASLAASN